MLEFTHKNKAGQHFIMTLFPQRYFLQGVGFTFYMISSYGCAITSEHVPVLKVMLRDCMCLAQLLLFNIPNKGRETFDFHQGFKKHHIYRGRTFSFTLHQETFWDGNAGRGSLSQRWPDFGKPWRGHRLPTATTEVFYPQIQQKSSVYIFWSIFWVSCRMFYFFHSSYYKFKTKVHMFVKRWLISFSFFLI